MKTFAVFALSLMLAASPGFPLSATPGTDRWKAIAGDYGEERILYDPGSIVPSGPRRFRVQVMGFDAAHSPRRSEEEYDCANRIVRDLEVVYEPHGQPVTRQMTPSEWRGVARQSPRGELLEILCR